VAANGTEAMVFNQERRVSFIVSAPSKG